MTDEQHQHVGDILEDTTELIINKYQKGAIEHGGNLWDKTGLIDMALDEAIDQVVYLLTLKKQIEDSGIQLGKVSNED